MSSLYPRIAALVSLALLGAFAAAEPELVTPNSFKARMDSAPWERRINESREGRLRELAPKMMPDCVIKASDSDVAAFFPYWQGLVRQEIARRAALGGNPKDLKRTQESFARATGMHVIPNAPLEELEHVGPQTPDAVQYAREEIETWNTLHCITARYEGHRYFAKMVNAGHNGMQWPIVPILGSKVDAGKTRSTAVPDMLNLEPAESLGKFFHAAQSKGLLKFADAAEEAYFYARYQSPNYDTMLDGEKAEAWFARAPWQSAVAKAEQER